MPKTNRSLQRVIIRRQNAETQDIASDIETRASVEISQTVSFAALKSDTVPVYHATWEFDAKNFGKCPEHFPRKGDVIIGKNNVEWHVQKSSFVTHRKVQQCQAYAKMTGFLPFESFHIIRPCAAKLNDGLRMTTVWRRTKLNVPAKIAPEEIATHRKNKAKNIADHLRAYTREHLSLQKNDLIELPDGRQYKIVRVRNSRPMLGWTELFLAINNRPVAVEND